MIHWCYFPNTDTPNSLIMDLIDVFRKNANNIDSETHEVQDSNTVLKKLTRDLQSLSFNVETGKKNSEKIHIPVLYGIDGKIEKRFEADAFHQKEGIVLEIEAGRAVTNYQFLKDLFQACMMQDVIYLSIAVRNTYKKSKDFNKVVTFFDTLYKSDRLILPLKGVLIIGY